MANRGTTECPVCLINYHHELCIPKVLSCGHTFCVNCLGQLCKQAQIGCPQCSQTCAVPTLVSGLPTNFLALGEVEAVSLGHDDSCRIKSCRGSRDQTDMTQLRATQAELATLRQELDKLHDVTVNKEHPHAVRKEMQDVKRDIKVLCDSYHKATETLIHRLMKHADKIEQDCLQSYKSWQKDSFLKQGEVQAFLQSSDLDITGADVSSEVMEVMQHQCGSFHLQLQSVSSSLPRMDKYTLRTREETLFDIAKSADIVSHPVTTAAESKGQRSLSAYCADGGYRSENLDQPGTSSINATHSPIHHPNEASGNHSPDSGHVDNLHRIPSGLSPQYDKAELVKEVGCRGETHGLFLFPRGVTCLKNDYVIIANQGHSRVHILGCDLKPVSYRQLGRSIGLTDVATDSKGRIFFTEYKKHRIQVIDEQYHCLYKFGSDGSDPGYYNHPSGIAIDNRDRVYVCDQDNGRVQVVSSNGNYIITLTRTGSGQGQLRSQPRFISTNSENHVTVSDAGGRLYTFDDSGKHLRTLNSHRKGSFGRAGGTVSDQWGNLLVVDRDAGRVAVLDRRGQVTCWIGTSGKKPGQLWIPWGITLNNEGDLLVCDMNNHAVLKYRVPKTATVV